MRSRNESRAAQPVEHKPPAWANTAANIKPKGWRRTIRSSHWPDVGTLGDIVNHAYGRAKKQIATAPIIDLPQLYGSP